MRVKDLGRVIKYYRLKANLTQEELGRCADLTKGFISLVESGDRDISLQSLCSISYGLRIHVGFLLIQAVPDTGCLNYTDNSRELLYRTIIEIKKL